MHNPYGSKEVKEVLAEQTGNFSATVDFSEDKTGDLPVTISYHSAAARLPLYQATKISQTYTLDMVDNPTTGMNQFKLQGRAYENGCSDEEPDEKEATKGIQIQEVNKFMSVGVLSTDLH